MTTFEIVNTVNTALNNRYDFAIHAAGCQDVARAKKQGCTVDAITAADVAGAEDWIREDLLDGGFGEDDVADFIVAVLPCAHKATTRPIGRRSSSAGN